MLGYDETSVSRNMTIAVTNAGTVDGADTVTEVSAPMLLSNAECMLSSDQPYGRNHTCMCGELT